MDLFEMIKVLWRRWYLVLPVGLLTLALAGFVHTTTPPEFQARGFLQLETPDLHRAANPSWLSIDPVALSQGITVDGDAGFSVSPLEGQYFSIAAADDTSQGARDTAGQVISDLGAQIVAIQDAQEVPDLGRVELRMAAPEIAVEVQPDGTYLAKADMFLYNSNMGSSNPYGPDASTRRLLQVAATGDAGRARFIELAGTDVTYEVGQDTRDAAALLEVVTRGSDPGQVIEAFDAARTVMAEDLAARQARADVAPGERITLGVLSAPLTATDVSPPVNRATVGIIGIGGLLALGLAFGAESVHARRSAGRRGDVGPSRVGREPPHIDREPPESQDAPPAESSSTSASPDNGSSSDAADGLPEPMVQKASTPSSLPGNTPAPVVTADLDFATPSIRDPRLGKGTNGASRSQPGKRETVMSAPVDIVGEGEILTGHMAKLADRVGPGVLVIPDWTGLDAGVQVIVERLAAAGFVALAPDLYGGVRPRTPHEADALMNDRSFEGIMGQLSAALDYLERRWFVVGSKAGVFGTSMGGGLALALAATEPDRVGAGVCYYPVGNYDDVDLARVEAPFLVHVGSVDPVVDPDTLAHLVGALEHSHAPLVRVHTYPGAGHFFLDAGNEFGTFDARLADSTWKASLAFMNSRLRMRNPPVPAVSLSPSPIQ